MALGLDGDALDRSRYARSSQRLPTTEGSQATSNTTCRPRSAPEQKLNPRRHCSPSQRRVMSILAATASQCSTKRRDIPPRNSSQPLLNCHKMSTPKVSQPKTDVVLLPECEKESSSSS